jgi:hypothetical protein
VGEEHGLMALKNENVYEKTRFFPSSRILSLALPPPYFTAILRHEMLPTYVVFKQQTETADFGVYL